MVVIAANAPRAPSYAVDRSFFTDTAPGRRLRFRDVAATSSESRSAWAARALPRGEPVDCPRSTRTRWRTWRGGLCGQRGASSTPRRWSRLFFSDAAPGRRLRGQSLATIAFRSSAVRPTRTSPRGEPVDCPRSTRALGDLAVWSSQSTRGTLHPTPLAKAHLLRLRARSAAAASKHLGHSVRLPCRAAHARIAPWRTGRLPTEHSCASGLGVVVFAANARGAPPHAVG